VRILHTSDWHLGRSFHRVGLLEAQAAVLDHLVEVVRSERVDAVVVAGDVYDRALPGVEVVALLDEALARLAGTGAAVVISSGNHDSPRRLGFGARLLEHARVHVRTDPARCGEPVLLADRWGDVAVYALPYLEPALAGPALGCPPGAGHEQTLGAALSAVRADRAGRGPGTRTVVSAHAFVVGGLASDSERDISVGGVGAVPAGLFAGADYVALGHLHGRQRLAEAVRYSGSPLAYSFSEHAHVKGSWLVELGRDGLERVDPVDAPVPRQLAVLRGRLDDLLARPDLAYAEGAWCQVTLTDDERPAEAMTRVRSRFPHALELRFEPASGGASAGAYTRRAAEQDDLGLCCGFLEHVRHRPPGDDETAVLRAALEGARVGLARESGVAPLRAGRRLIPAGSPAPVTPASEPAAAELAAG
jgi:DNA repair protein SbcD/Mre11